MAPLAEDARSGWGWRHVAVAGCLLAIVGLCLVSSRFRTSPFDQLGASLRARTTPPGGRVHTVGPVEDQTFVLRSSWEVDVGALTFVEYAAWVQGQLGPSRRTETPGSVTFSWTQNNDSLSLEVAPVASSARVRMRLTAGGS